MAEYYKIPAEKATAMKDSLLNRTWKVPDIPLALPKGAANVPGKWGVWEEPVMIEDYSWERDDATEEETVRVAIRATGESPENTGKGYTEFYRFPVREHRQGAPTNKVQQFEIAWKNLMGLYQALGNEDWPDIGSINPDLMRGARVTAIMRVAPDRTTQQPRQDVVRWSSR